MDPPVRERCHYHVSDHQTVEVFSLWQFFSFIL